MTTRSFSLQPGQPDEGLDYNPNKPLPYPLIVDHKGLTANVPGYALAGRPGARPLLVGFTETAEPDPDGLVLRERWVTDPEIAVGMHPVFAQGGDMFSLTEPITRVTAFEDADALAAADPEPADHAATEAAERAWEHEAEEARTDG